MSSLIHFPSPPQHVLGYRIGDVFLDVPLERLVVKGGEVPLSPMVFKLLLSLCRADGRVLSRDEAFALLWPGGGVATDEALAQVIRKARVALGLEGTRLKTIRGRGYAIDAPVRVCREADVDLVARDEPAVTRVSTRNEQSAANSAAPSTQSKRTRRAVWFFTGAALLIAVIVLAQSMRRDTAVSLPGLLDDARSFGDISRSGTAVLRTALKRNEEGDRASAEHLLESIVDSEPNNVAAPFLLTLWSTGSARQEDSARWRKLLAERIPSDATPYVRLLARWLLVDDTPGAEYEVLNSALKLNPDAWQLRFARAHVLLRLSRFDDALADMRLIPLDRIGDRQAMFLMSDRASLGDASAIEAQLAHAQIAPAFAAYIRGRVAMSRGQWSQAEDDFEAAGRIAHAADLVGSLAYAGPLAAISAAAQGDWTAAESLASTSLRFSTEHKLPALAIIAGPLHDYALHRMAPDGDADWTQAERAVNAIDDVEDRARLWLIETRTQPAKVSDAPSVEQPDEGFAALLQARRAWAVCHDVEAARLLNTAAAAGVDGTYHADEADLLRQDLALARRQQPAPPRIPYPPFLRWLTYFETSQPAGPRACQR